MRIRTLSLGLLVLATGTHRTVQAADAAQPAPTNVTTADTVIETVVVETGRLVTNPNLAQSSPVGVIGADEIALRQVDTADQFLREVPGIVGNSGANTGNGQRGAAFVNLRGLGVNRNIVMLNSARLTPLGLDGQADLNNIPLALIDRVDVLTGGASTTYGADAVSGVINFITKKDFSGAQFDVADTQTEQGDGNHFRVDATFGANLDDGRGNATFSIGYQKADPVYQGQRSYGVYALAYQNGQQQLSGTTVPTRFSLGAQSFQIDPQTGGFPATTISSASTSTSRTSIRSRSSGTTCSAKRTTRSPTASRYMARECSSRIRSRNSTRPAACSGSRSKSLTATHFFRHSRARSSARPMV